MLKRIIDAISGSPDLLPHSRRQAWRELLARPVEEVERREERAAEDRP